MTRSYQVKGFVLARRNVGEADRIVMIFSLEQGRFSAAARGVRRAGAKLMSQLEPYAEVRLQLVETRGLPIITGATILQVLKPAEDYEVLIEAQSILELTSQTMGDDQPDVAWYEHLKLSLSVLADEKVALTRRRLVWLSLLVHSLEVLGIAPDMPTDPQQRYFDIREGHWQKRGGYELSPAALKLWRFLSQARPHQILKLTHADAAIIELLPIVEQFWSYHSGISLKSRSLA